ncbi:septation initiation protein [Citrobacter freundii]|nr:septation initiation protein [Citrobacter freundii]MBA8331716.1 septation initiation protein [Citrobacter freundii]QLM88149.1 septation initiation protein [Citrobacter freundii]QMM24103.1 septation initiation protein [Citrobacter freundii]
MTIPDQRNNPTADISIPASTQQALEKVDVAKSAWMEARRKQADAAGMLATIRKRRVETEAEAKAQNEEWRQMFHENQGQVTPKMKKLRAEIALGRETLDEFDDLLAAHAGENELLPWETAKLARGYIEAHDALIEAHVSQLWDDFMKQHGQTLIQLLSLLKVTKGRSASSIIGVVHSVNDPETLLRDFVTSSITNPALKQNASLQSDPFLKKIGVLADKSAYQDVQNAPSPAAQVRIQKRREKAKKEQS